MVLIASVINNWVFCSGRTSERGAPYISGFLYQRQFIDRRLCDFPARSGEQVSARFSYDFRPRTRCRRRCLIGFINGINNCKFILTRIIPASGIHGARSFVLLCSRLINPTPRVVSRGVIAPTLDAASNHYGHIFARALGKQGNSFNRGARSRYAAHGEEYAAYVR